ncbi:alpha/beta-hydrolase [Microthyrium microscopicum]|uniref:1-alkyl-2-acetylglycerophosphocholine esterase n=1 Tax=Microthyrium microscopicum TaxID=703497 RepID=A0A6A6UB71_9PEZI|nr:alpha/beta-hydrolase [Microthyrium microscopicum]
MHINYHALIGAAAQIRISLTIPVTSFSPVVLPIPGRIVDLQLRVTVPSTGNKLPIVLLSHGQGYSNYISSLDGYAPLYEFYASHGFAVLQPTHLSSLFLKITAPYGQEFWWQDRALDMTRILDNLDKIEETVPGLKGRLDRTRVAVVGHSMGAGTAAMLLGLQNTDPRNGSVWYKPETRIKAGVLLSGVGKGGADMSESGSKMMPFYGPDFSKMVTPALVVYGDKDVSPHLTKRGADWHGDIFTLAPKSKDLLVIKGGGHGLGGVAAWDAAETKDESPERLAVVQRMSLAYLRSQLFGDGSWAEARKAFEKLPAQGMVQSRD